MPFSAVELDLRVAWRGLRRAKAFTTAAILTLAVGIAGTTIMFALAEGVLLRALPVHDQDRLIVAWKELRASGYAHYPFGDRDIEALNDASRLLEGVAGVTANGAVREIAIEDGDATYIRVALVTGRFFRVLGIEPIAGRTLTSGDDVEGAESVAVISEGLWTRRYGRSPGAIGRRIRLGEQQFTIIGVVSSELDYPRGTELWRTTRSVATNGPFGDAARQEIDLVARLRQEVTVEQARSELAAIVRSLESSAPVDVPRGLVPVVHPLEEIVIGDARLPILALVCAVALVLIIAMANVANLLLMRAEARRGELAMRRALGAGRIRIAREVLAESAIISLPAAGAGLLAAWWGLDMVLALSPDGLPRTGAVRIDAGTALFTVVVACVASLVVALVPALSATRADVMSQLRSGTQAATRPSRSPGRRGLVIAQVALAVIVATAAGLLMRTVHNLQAIDLGVSAERLLLFDLAVPQTKYTDRARHGQFLDALISQLEATPAIQAATPVNTPPFSEEAGWDVPRFTAEGQDVVRAAANPALNLESVHPNYFSTLEIPLLRGRTFAATDRESSTPVAIVSEDVAARTWPAQDPIGKRLKLGGPDSTDPWRTVVGVAGQTRYRELATLRPTLYLPAAQFLMTARMIAVRTTAPLDRVASLARDRVRAVDPQVEVIRVARFGDLLARPLARPRFGAYLSTVFGMAALLLVSVGLYAVLAAHVRFRSREIGLRVALGASGRDVRRLVLDEAFRVVGIGSALGVALTAAAAPYLKGLLFGVHPLDAFATSMAVLLILAIGALASYAPIRWARRLDPVTVLHSE